jgi:periplasmic divalent cation tolerance protein
VTEYIVAFITASKEEEAAHIARELVGARLAACVNITKDIRSIYRWQGKIEDEVEVLLVVKTRADLFEDLVKKVRELHSYTVPEIIALPIVKGSEDYLKWLKDETINK